MIEFLKKNKNILFIIVILLAIALVFVNFNKLAGLLMLIILPIYDVLNKYKKIETQINNSQIKQNEIKIGIKEIDDKIKETKENINNTNAKVDEILDKLNR